MDDEDDISLWDRIARTVNPLNKDDLGTLSEEKSLDIKPKKASSDSKTPVKIETFKVGENSPVNASDGPSNKGLDRKTDQRLKKGKLPIDGRLDLHGYRQDEAKAALESFLKSSYEQGKRCLLVITGKGTRHKDNSADDWTASRPGILRQRVPEWLRMAPSSNIVLRYYHAKPKDGGEGALYVYLRRKRP